MSFQSHGVKVKLTE